MIRKFIFVLFVLIVCVAPAAEADEAFAVTATVSGADPDRGQVVGNLFNSKKTYMRVPVIQVVVPVGSDGNVELDFGAQPGGDYAITVVYDENSNGKLDTGFLRIPKEKIGYSNNARGKFGPAKWKATRFALSEDTHVDIDLQSVNVGKNKD